MEITKIELENFKNFKSAEIPFRKITLLTGENSAGKSTILNALGLITNSTEDKLFPFYFSNDGFVFAGGYKDIVNNGKIKQKIKLGISYSHEGESFYASGSYMLFRSEIVVDELIINNSEIQFQMKKFPKDGYKVKKMFLKKHHEEKNNFGFIAKQTTNMLLSMINDVSNGDKNEIERINTEMKEFYSDTFSDSSDWQDLDYKSPNLNMDLWIKKSRILDLFSVLLGKNIKSLSKGIRYHFPVRSSPKRYYESRNLINRSSLEDSTLNFVREWSKQDTSKILQINRALNLIGLADVIETDFINDGLFEVKIKPKGCIKSYNFGDVGFGVSQMLPVIVSIIEAGKNATHLINQPEVHLHPSSQAQLANYFLEQSKDKRFVIETHSEYIINRFRLLVARKELIDEDILILYVDNKSGSAQIHEITIGRNGELIGAPNSFFETYFIDNNEILMSGFEGE